MQSGLVSTWQDATASFTFADSSGVSFLAVLALGTMAYAMARAASARRAQKKVYVKRRDD
ncbi:hypothetical protein HCH_06441 [Hahella chejuensis KCTC 2396]|uniref:Uncharacterized protein n=1 Tax=Hahella chejuensis (strain KCTC 2396) TaxID=349521 RepID=Q2S8D8_HAHCH|nr:hypothetical protein [Hahella chejuensis]ABC33086.1 hypothetical protein HCH_06441 [Hahella chejuensis KCTC 2396]